MKAKIDNVEIVDCTPEELVKVVELLGKIDKNKTIKYEYVFTPSTQPNWFHDTKIICDSITTKLNDYWDNVSSSSVKYI